MAYETFTVLFFFLFVSTGLKGNLSTVFYHLSAKREVLDALRPIGIHSSALANSFLDSYFFFILFIVQGL